MSDYISRDAVLNSRLVIEVYDANEDIVDWGVSFDVIKAIPAADVAPVRRGHAVWVERPAVFAQYERHHDENGITMYVRTHAEVKDKIPYCSECGKRLYDRFMNFCPYCGARIDDEKFRV